MRSADDPEDGTAHRLAVYLAALKGDMPLAEDVHEAILRRGAETLDRGVPYVVRMARFQAASRRRREARQEHLLKQHVPTNEVVWDPLELLSRDEGMRRLIHGLAVLPDPDVFVLWGNAHGRTDEDLAAAWPFKGRRPKPDAIRKRRQRALEKLRAAVITERPGEEG